MSEEPRIVSVRWADGSWLWRADDPADHERVGHMTYAGSDPDSVQRIETFTRAGNGAMELWLRAYRFDRAYGEIPARHVMVEFDAPISGPTGGKA